MATEVNEKSTDLGELYFVGDDAVIPFEVDLLDARGRAVQLGASVTTILQRHNYPEPVSKLLAEVIVLTVLLGTSLKFNGKFIVQTSSDGPVNLLVSDFQTPSNIRGYARFDKIAFEKAMKEGKISPEELLGKGTLALTVDQGDHMQRYQGIVALDGSDLEMIARNYFEQSEQIPTNVKLAVAKLTTRDENGVNQEHWRAGGLLAQFLPHSSLHKTTAEEKETESELKLDHWREVKALTDTVGVDELTDPQVGVERLLYRLFHNTGVKTFDATKIKDQCSCSREKLKGILQGFSSEEIDESIENGEVSITCEFCSTTYTYKAEELKKVY